MSDLRYVLAKEFEDKEYAHAYAHAYYLEKLAAQIYACRVARDLSQTDLAAASGIPQAKLSKLESADVSSFTLGTLSKLALALDVAPVFGLEAFSEFTRKVACIPGNIPAREHDLQSMASVNRLFRQGDVWTGSVITDNASLRAEVANELKAPEAHE